MSVNEDDRFGDGGGLDLTSEPTSNRENAGIPNTTAINTSGGLTHFEVTDNCSTEFPCRLRSRKRLLAFCRSSQSLSNPQFANRQRQFRGLFV